MNDWELIQAWCREGSETAFATLVKRHVDFVYCSALRQVRDPALAEDVSQAVFLLLARKARSFRSGTVVASWLFRATRFIATRALRAETRRQRRELEAAQMNSFTTSPEGPRDPDWDRVAPVLDEALAALPGKDRDAVLLRFFNAKPFSQVAAETGVSEDAAKKRVARALDRLREFFARRGTTLSSAALLGILSERVVRAAPAATGAKISAALSAGVPASASSTAVTLLNAALRDLLWTKLKWGSVAMLGVAGLAWWLIGTPRPAGIKDSASPAGGNSAGNTAALPGNQARRISTAAPPAPQSEERRLSLLIAQAEDRKPVRGARVLVDCWAGSRMQRLLDSTTDSSGVVVVPIPGEFTGLNVWVSAEGRIPMIAQWQAHEFMDAVTPYTLVLERGQTASGVVRDEAGNPVPDAKVSFSGPGVDLSKRENREFHPELSASRTDAEGRWMTTQLPQERGKQVIVRVTHPDFTPAGMWLGGLPGFPTNLLLVLSNGVALSGQVTTTGGRPIADATVEKQGGAYLRTHTDGDGRFTFAHLEPGHTFVDIEATGFKTSHEGVDATNAANEFVFKLTELSEPALSSSEVPPIHLRGKVVDDETGAAIGRFKVVAGGVMPDSRFDGVMLSGRFLGEGRDGQFDWQIAPGEMPFRLLVEAENYSEALSGPRDASNADREFEFRLKRAVVLAGSVLTPEGLPADGAVLGLAGPGLGPVMQSRRPGELSEPNPGFEATQTRADHQGRFSLKVKTGAHGLAVVHESGCALLQFAAATNGPITLQAWGAVEGTVIVGGQPAPNQRVSLTGCEEVGSDPRLLLSFTYNATTDDRGHFRFDKVPPGQHIVAREVGYLDGGPAVVNYGIAVPVQVQSGVTAPVELRRSGRRVIGRMNFAGSARDVDWGMSEVYLTLDGSAPPQLDYERAPAASARANELYLAQNRFPFSFSKDGAIRADDVPPGNYLLSVRLKSASSDPLVFSEEIGSLQRKVTVPPAEDGAPLDLGELKVDRAK